MNVFRLPYALLLMAVLSRGALAGPGDPPPPPPVDLTAWRQVAITDIFGTQWPDDFNPEFVDWLVPKDGRPYNNKSETLTITRSSTDGNPPVTVTYSSITDVTMGIWIGDDGYPHYYVIYSFENLSGNTIVENFAGILYPSDGETSKGIFKTLETQAVPTSLEQFRSVVTIPEPQTAALCLGGLAIASVLARRRRPVG